MFIAGRIRFKGRYVTVSVTVSFLVMILAVAISSGFRKEIRAGISAVAGDISLSPVGMNVLNESAGMERHPSYLQKIEDMAGVESVVPAVYRAGIVKSGEEIHGVLFKGLPCADSAGMTVSVPSGLAAKLSLSPGDELLAYFVGDRVKVRKFKVGGIYDGIADSEDMSVVYAGMHVLQRVNGWDSDRVSALEISIMPEYRNERGYSMLEQDIGFAAGTWMSEDETHVVSSSAPSRYPQLFDWLNLIDFNVMFILILMTVVAGFNMISGLLILLFENISVIGLLKAVGMGDRSISRIFLAASSSLVLKGMLLGNVLALMFCLVQSKTHLLTLDPKNYFISFVPVNADWVLILAADAAAYLAIMLLLLIPCHFISKVDPADTVRVR